MTWTADIKDRIVTNHPGAVVTPDDANGPRLDVVRGGVRVVVDAVAEGFDVRHGRVGDIVFRVEWFGDGRDAADRVMGILGDAWRAEQRSKSQTGGPSSQGGCGEGCDAVSSDYYEPSESEDGGDDE